MTNYMEIIDNNYNWDQRLYNIFYKKHDGKLCKFCNVNKTKFHSFSDGYRECCNSNKCVSDYSASSNVFNYINKIKNGIEAQGFTIISNYNKYSTRSINKNSLKLLCSKCNTIIEKRLGSGKWKKIYCYGCNGKMGISQNEKYITDFISSYLPDSVILRNSRPFEDSKHELDIYIEDKKIAIEFNGNIWHSYGKIYPKNIQNEKNRKYNHLFKTEKCHRNGINLYHICSTEWNCKKQQKIWESILMHKVIGKCAKIHARKCQVVEISQKEADAFLDENHLMGIANSSVRLGLYYNHKLVSIMCFSKSRFTKKYQWEIVRFCNILNSTVVGGASKLFKYFIRNYNPDNVATYCNRRYSRGDVFLKMGFEHTTNTPISFLYTKGDITVSRYAAQKHKQYKFLKKFDPSKSANQNMLDNRYRRLWDCGHMLFVWNK